MSKLAESIYAHRTNERARELGPLSDLVEVNSGFITTFDLTRYEMKVTIGANVMVQDGPTHRMDLDRAIDQVKRSVIEHVFGEFRVGFREVQMLLRERKISEASYRLDKLERGMFEV